MGTILTNEQQRLVEENHNLIYGFANYRNLDIDNYYDILAIGLCNAARIFDKSKGVFSTVAYNCMNREVIKNWHKSKRKHSIPKDKILSYDFEYNREDSTILNCLCDIHCPYEDVEYDMMLEEFIDQLTEKERKAFEYRIKGMTYREIAVKLNVTHQRIDQYMNNIYKKYNNYIKN